MALFAVPHVAIAGISAIVPAKELSNRDYTWLSEQDRELLIKTTGIESRRVLEGQETMSDLSIPAAEKLITSLGWNKSEIQLLILVTQSADYIVPATAIILQDKLGLGKHCIAFDVNLGCSGYVYGLSIIASMMSSGKLKKGLMIAGDISSKGINPKDKSAAPLFSDAAAVTALEYREDAAPMHFCLQSDGAGFEAIIIPDGGIKNPVSPSTLTEVEIEPGIIRNKRQIALNGMDIFSFSLREVAPNIESLLTGFSIPKDQIDFWVFHQANLLMNETIRKKLKLEPEKVPYSLQKYGNTSSATIPVTIIHKLAEQLKDRESRLVLSGFGVGLSWGSCALTLKNTCILPMIEWNQDLSH